MNATVFAALDGALTTLENAVNGRATHRNITAEVRRWLVEGGPEAVSVVREVGAVAGARFVSSLSSARHTPL